MVPLLVENGLQDRADRVLVIDVDAETQLARTIARDGVSREQAQSISPPSHAPAALAVADDIIDRASGARRSHRSPHCIVATLNWRQQRPNRIKLHE